MFQHISTYYNNFNNEPVLHVAKALLKNCKNERLKRAFDDVKFIQSFKQPPNILRTLSHSKFERNRNQVAPGVHKCSSARCKICKLYLQVETEVSMNNGVIWQIRCVASCNSLNVLYFLECIFCGLENYIGKTDNCRERTNNHISGCRYGRTPNIFDQHVHTCATAKGMNLLDSNNEPFFKLHILMVCSNYYKLLSYESALHKKGLDTMNS